jgi:hypothetical protein
MAGRHQVVEVLSAPEGGVDPGVVGDVIAEVRKR